MYKPINTQSDLDELDSTICWEDSTLKSAHISGSAQNYFPNDISGSGYNSKHYHCLYEISGSNHCYLEIVYINCHQMAEMFIERPFFAGIVQIGKQIRITDYKGASKLECDRIIYRSLELESCNEATHYFQRPGVISYENYSKFEDGYYYSESEGKNIFLEKVNQEIELTMVSEDFKETVRLNKDDLINLTDALLQLINKI